MAELKKVKKLFGRNSEIVADFGAGRQESSSQKAEERILAYLRRRPATVKDLSATTGYSSRELGEPLQRLLEKGKIRSGKHKGRLFFQLGRQPA
jgi:predicted Rossmann fold nucleotide-binding protein DprA/Smf involved in DNA uptake